MPAIFRRLLIERSICSELPPLLLLLSRFLPPCQDLTTAFRCLCWGLDLGVPAEGWPVFLGSRGIAFRSDDLGRDAISRGDAKRLIAERRESEVRRAQKQAVLEREAVEQDQLRRAQIWRGVPATAIPDGVLASTAMLQAAKDAQPRRRSMVEEAFSGSDTMVFHSLQDES